MSTSEAVPLLPIESTAKDTREQLRAEIAEVFDQFRAPLLRYLQAFGLEIQDGEEILQDVFLALFRDLDRGKRIDNVRAWLFRAAHNLALRRRNRASRETQTTADPIDPAHNPEDRMVNCEAHLRVNALIEALPEQHRRCLSLRAEGLRYRDIAEILDMSLGAVSQSIARTLGRIARSTQI